MICGTLMASEAFWTPAEKYMSGERCLPTSAQHDQHDIDIKINKTLWWDYKIDDISWHFWVCQGYMEGMITLFIQQLAVVMQGSLYNRVVVIRQWIFNIIVRITSFQVFWNSLPRIDKSSSFTYREANFQFFLQLSNIKRQLSRMLHPILD